MAHEQAPMPAVADPNLAPELAVGTLPMPDPAAVQAEQPGLLGRIGAAAESLRQDPAVHRVGRAALVGAGVELGVIRETEQGIRVNKAALATRAATILLTRGAALRPMAIQAAAGARAGGYEQFRQELRAEMPDAA